MKKIIEEKGSITTMVIVTVIFFLTILSSAYMVTAKARESQIKSQSPITEMYSQQVKEAPQIAENLITK